MIKRVFSIFACLLLVCTFIAGNATTLNGDNLYFELINKKFEYKITGNMFDNVYTRGGI